jgi:hypothetical protein
MSDAIHMVVWQWHDLVTFTESQALGTPKVIKRGAYTQHLAASERNVHTDLTDFMIHQQLHLSLVELLPVSVSLR